jgi:cytoskeletal protein RodZ
MGPMTNTCESFGTTLRGARERAGVSIRHIADTTKLSVRNLRALEDNHITQLPGGIYRRAIVRAYAAHVGLDPEVTLRAFLEQYPDEVPTWDDLRPLPHRIMRRGPIHAIRSVMTALTR